MDPMCGQGMNLLMQLRRLYLASLHGVRGARRAGNGSGGKVRAQEEQIKRLKKAGERSTEFCLALEMTLDVVEHQGRCNNIQFLGLKESEEEVLEVVEVGEKLGVKLTPSDFDGSHRLGSSSPVANQREKHRPLLVKFSSHRTRGLVMGARSRLKGIDIFINDDLTPARQKLLYSVRHCPKVEQSFSQKRRIFAGINNTYGGYTKKLITCDADIANSRIASHRLTNHAELNKGSELMDDIHVVEAPTDDGYEDILVRVKNSGIGRLAIRTMTILTERCYYVSDRERRGEIQTRTYYFENEE